MIILLTLHKELFMSKKVIKLLVCVSVLSISTSLMGAEKTAGNISIFKNEADKLSYAIGMSISSSLKRTEKDTDLNYTIIIQAIKDMTGGKEPLLSDDEMKEVLGTFQTKMREKAMAAQKEQQAKVMADAPKNIAIGKAYLEANKKKEGVKVTASGLQYKVLKQGTGPKPAKSDKVRVHYTGTFVDGKEFDSSVKRGKPAEFPVTGVIKGWTEALLLMNTGSKWQLAIPSELAYGKTGRAPSMPPSATLLFDVELLDIVK